MGRLPQSPFLYAITDRSLARERSIGRIVGALCDAGVQIIQLREKGRTTRELRSLALEAAEAARGGGAKLIINDRPDVALYSGADGVHLGEDDMPPEAARGVLGPEAIIGVSCHSLEDVRAMAGRPADYIAVGPVFATDTKELRHPVAGVELVRKARRLTDLPLVAIGGIRPDKAGLVVEAGADGLAVISALMAPGEIGSRSESFISILRSA